MKMKCTVCEVEFAVRKDVAEKRAEKGITAENYICLKCRDKKVNTIYNITCTTCGKSVKSNKKRSEKLIADGKMETYQCRSCKPKVEKPAKVKKIKKTKVVKEVTNKTIRARDAFGRFVKKAA